MKDHYAILGVGKGASQKEIETAFKKLAKQYHPDRNHGKPPKEIAEAEEMMALINKAKEVLGDPEKRKEYDNPSSPAGVAIDPMKKTEAEEMADILKKAFRKL